MNRLVLVALLMTLAGTNGANAQVTPAPVPPPSSPVPAPNPPSPMSPLLTNPGFALTPYAPRAAAPSGPSVSPLNQQQNQAYQNQLNSEQRALDRAGVSPGSEQYRDVQQQLNQLNGGR